MRATILMLVLVGCASAPKVKPEPLVSEARRVETRELPPHPREVALPDDVSSASWTRPFIPTEHCAADAGILVSEARAYQDAQYRIRYEEIRKNYTADQAVWGAHRELYETKIVLDHDELERRKPSWWEKHDAQVVGIGAFIVGTLVTVATVAASRSIGDNNTSVTIEDERQP
jgi:hypothetical protein